MSYIDRETVMLKIQRHLMPNVGIDGTVTVEDAERYFLKLLNEQPSADVVEPVRCKDCIKTSPFDDGLLRFCKKMQEYRYPDNYCSDGRRRKTNGPQ